jgi:hypothetical protein
MVWIEKGRKVWLALLLLVVVSNYAVYQTSMGIDILPVPEEALGVVVGSFIDLMIVAPVLFMLYVRKFSWKLSITLAAFGCIALRLIIPVELLGPFEKVTLIGIGVELLLVIIELIMIVTFVRYMPKIIRDVKESTLPVLFSFHHGINRYVKHNPIIQVLCAEALMFYYAVLSWKKTPMPGITLYKKSSYIAFQVMMIHAIIVETLGIHYFIHDKWPIVSIVLLVFNVYSIFFFVGDIQAVRMNPIVLNAHSLYISQGLMKRAEIDFSHIECIIEDREFLESKRKKDTVEFVMRDFETVYPDFVLKMKVPQKATLFMGIEKEYNYVAIKCDDPLQLKEILVAKVGE